MKKFFLIICAALLMTGCGNEEKIPLKPAQNKINLNTAKDEIYTIESSLNEEFSKSVLILTIKDKKIIAAEFEGHDLLGNVKDKNYGSLTGKDSADYKKAQVAVDAI